jgi:hypothetical protein
VNAEVREGPLEKDGRINSTVALEQGIKCLKLGEKKE